MFHFFSKQRFHESIAIAIVFAASIALHVAWIYALLVMRIPRVYALVNIVPSIGPVFGIYLKSFCTFIIVFIGTAFFLRGKDCAPYRTHIEHFFLLSLFVFVVMTLPFISQFSLVIE